MKEKQSFKRMEEDAFLCCCLSHGLFKCLGPNFLTGEVFVSTGVALEATYFSHPHFKPLSQTVFMGEIREECRLALQIKSKSGN